MLKGFALLALSGSAAAYTLPGVLMLRTSSRLTSSTMLDKEPHRSAIRGSPMPWKLQRDAVDAVNAAPTFFAVEEIPEDPTITCWLSQDDEETAQYVCTDARSLMSDFDDLHLEDASEVSLHS